MTIDQAIAWLPETRERVGGEVYPVELLGELLQAALQNTVTMLQTHVVVSAAEEVSSDADRNP